MNVCRVVHTGKLHTEHTLCFRIGLYVEGTIESSRMNGDIITVFDMARDFCIEKLIVYCITFFHPLILSDCVRLCRSAATAATDGGGGGGASAAIVEQRTPVNYL